MSSYHLDYLDFLETEAIYIVREVISEFERPVLLFSGGKDSVCLLRIAEKAFYPSQLPLPLLNIDSGHHFPELNEFRDRRAKEIQANLIVRSIQSALDNKIIQQSLQQVSRNKLQIPVLLHAINEFRFDACLGGARRDEEKSRSKERIFSFRDSFGQWEPKNQRPEIWNLYNSQLYPGENMRIFPLSNWTEMDIWAYLKREKLEIPSLYFSHLRRCVKRGNQWQPYTEFLPPKEGEEVKEMFVRVRTIGDIISTGCIESNATTMDQIIDEISIARTTERSSRNDDRLSDTAMEDRKKSGYF